MAYSSSNVRKILDIGFASAGGMYLYTSSDAATDITATAYFAGAGAGGRPLSSDSGRAHGMRYGDIVMNRESSGGVTPGRVTLHAVTASTADQASTVGSTGYNTMYNVTVSAHAST